MTNVAPARVVMTGPELRLKNSRWFTKKGSCFVRVERIRTVSVQ